jgi:hypothetical protein
VKHLRRAELLQLLRGKGKGRARWSSAYEVMQARKYVEQHAEHVFDYAALANLSAVALRGQLNELYKED